MPTPTQLRYIIAVDELRHFGKAAKACHVSQPSMSMQIQKVEEELNLQIFDRNQKPIGVTDKGRLFLQQARTVIFEHEKLLQVAKQQIGIISGDFRLGIIPTLATSLLPAFLLGFAKAYPKVHLFIEEMKTGDIIKALLEDSLDGAILATPLSEAQIVEKPFCYEPFSLYLSKSHPLYQKNRIKIEELDIAGLWLLKEGHCLRKQVLDFCSGAIAQGQFNNVSFEGGSLETLVELVDNCGGYTLLPQLMLTTLNKKQLTGLRSFAGTQPIRELSIVLRKGHWKEDIADALLTLLIKAVPAEFSREKHKQQKLIPL